MKIFSYILLFIPGALFAQGKVGINTTNPVHPFQVNVDSMYLNFSLDQEQNLAEDSVLIEESQSILQTFVAGQTGHLAKCRIDMGRPVYEIVLLEVYRGPGPYGTQLANGELMDTSGTGVLEFVFNPPFPEVMEGETLHMILTPLVGSNFWRNSLGDSYPNGQAQFFDGTNWSSLPHDMVFKTYLENQDTANVQSLSVQSDGRVRVKNYLLPASDGNEDEVITTNGDGSLIWANPTTLGKYDEIIDTDGDTRITVEEVPDEDAIRFFASGLEKFILKPDGKIGIGTSVPAGRIHIRHFSSPSSPHLELMDYNFNAYSRIKFNNQIYPNIDWELKAKVDPSATNSRFELHYTNDLWTGNKITVLGNGQVGINTDTPGARLDIKVPGEGYHILKFSTDRPWIFKQTYSGDSSALSLQGTSDNLAFDIASYDGSNRAARFLVDTDSSMVGLVPDGGLVGIGTDQPTALLHVESGAVLFNGPEDSLPTMPADPPASGSGTRMMWYPDKAAFRVGRVFGTAWDRDSIGQYSFAGGFGNKAKGTFSFVGSGEGGNHALGTHSFVGNGRDNIASGNYAFIGNGNDSYATGDWSFVGAGSGNTSSGDFSFIGAGTGLYARSFAETALGLYCTDYTPASTTSFNDTDRLFVIGNGSSYANSRDAFTILKNGNVGIGTSTPGNKMHVEGSTTSLEPTLSVKNNYSGTLNVLAIKSTSNPANGFGIGGEFTGGSIGMRGVASATGTFNGLIKGIEGVAAGGSAGTPIGVYGTAAGGNTSWAGYFANGNVRVENDMFISGKVGVGIAPSSAKLHIVGNSVTNSPVLQVATTYTGNVHVRAVEGVSVPNAGWGFGGHFTGGAVGVVGSGSGGSNASTSIGVEGAASGTAGTRIGIRGNASGGTTNWAGFFGTGNVYITNELRIGSGAESGATGYKVAIDGKMIAEEVRVQLSGDWPDYVFKDDYHLQSLSDVDKFIKNNGHLPGIPSAVQVEQSGQHLGEIQIKLLEKIEELTLHLIALQKQNDALIIRVNDLEKNAKSTD